MVYFLLLDQKDYIATNGIINKHDRYILFGTFGDS